MDAGRSSPRHGDPLSDTPLPRWVLVRVRDLEAGLEVSADVPVVVADADAGRAEAWADKLKGRTAVFVGDVTTTDGRAAAEAMGRELFEF